MISPDAIFPVILVRLTHYFLECQSPACLPGPPECDQTSGKAQKFVTDLDGLHQNLCESSTMPNNRKSADHSRLPAPKLKVNSCVFVKAAFSRLPIQPRSSQRSTLVLMRSSFRVAHTLLPFNFLSFFFYLQVFIFQGRALCM
jgi:hypothetical protein